MFFQRLVQLKIEKSSFGNNEYTNRNQAVFLVGGFGQSPYLFIKIRDAVQSQGIEVRRLPGDKA
jgi:hypothetical protein